MSNDCDDEGILRFLCEYIKYECLWNPYDENYRNSSVKNEAFRKILHSLNGPTLSVEDLLILIEYIEKEYEQEQDLQKAALERGETFCSKHTWTDLFKELLKKIINDESKCLAGATQKPSSSREKISNNKSNNKRNTPVKSKSPRQNKINVTKKSQPIITKKPQEPKAVPKADTKLGKSKKSPKSNSKVRKKKKTVSIKLDNCVPEERTHHANSPASDKEAKMIPCPAYSSQHDFGRTSCDRSNSNFNGNNQRSFYCPRSESSNYTFCNNCNGNHTRNMPVTSATSYANRSSQQLRFQEPFRCDSGRFASEGLLSSARRPMDATMHRTNVDCGTSYSRERLHDTTLSTSKSAGPSVSVSNNETQTKADKTSDYVLITPSGEYVPMTKSVACDTESLKKQNDQTEQDVQTECCTRETCKTLKNASSDQTEKKIKSFLACLEKALTKSIEGSFNDMFDHETTDLERETKSNCEFTCDVCSRQNVNGKHSRGNKSNAPEDLNEQLEELTKNFLEFIKRDLRKKQSCSNDNQFDEYLITLWQASKALFKMRNVVKSVVQNVSKTHVRSRKPSTTSHTRHNAKLQEKMNQIWNESISTSPDLILCNKELQVKSSSTMKLGSAEKLVLQKAFQSTGNRIDARAGDALSQGKLFEEKIIEAKWPTANFSVQQSHCKKVLKRCASTQYATFGTINCYTSTSLAVKDQQIQKHFNDEKSFEHKCVGIKSGVKIYVRNSAGNRGDSDEIVQALQDAQIQCAMKSSRIPKNMQCRGKIATMDVGVQKARDAMVDQNTCMHFYARDVQTQKAFKDEILWNNKCIEVKASSVEIGVQDSRKRLVPKKKLQKGVLAKCTSVGIGIQSTLAKSLKDAQTQKMQIDERAFKDKCIAVKSSTTETATQECDARTNISSKEMESQATPDNQQKCVEAKYSSEEIGVQRTIEINNISTTTDSASLMIDQTTEVTCDTRDVSAQYSPVEASHKETKTSFEALDVAVQKIEDTFDKEIQVSNEKSHRPLILKDEETTMNKPVHLRQEVSLLERCSRLCDVVKAFSSDEKLAERDDFACHKGCLDETKLHIDWSKLKLGSAFKTLPYTFKKNQSYMKHDFLEAIRRIGPNEA